MIKYNKMHSQFLPVEYNNEPIVLIAGEGRYPALISEKIKEKAIPLKLISFIDQTDPALIQSFDVRDHQSLHVGQLSKILDSIKTFQCPYVIMAGKINSHLLFKGMNPDAKMQDLLSSIQCHNAETIFGAFVQEIEAIGKTVLDARSFLDEHLAKEGCMTGGTIQVQPNYIEYGQKIVQKIAKLNIGQGIVTRKNTVLAVEAYEGTNKMLKRVSDFKTDALVFFKTIKQNQDHRFDVPIFGMKTLELMIKSNIKTAVLETDSVIILDKEEIINQAKANQVQLIGVDSNHFREGAINL